MPEANDNPLDDMQQELSATITETWTAEPKCSDVQAAAFVFALASVEISMELVMRLVYLRRRLLDPMWDMICTWEGQKFMGNCSYDKFRICLSNLK